jgi:hypothetical protein
MLHPDLTKIIIILIQIGSSASKEVRRKARRLKASATRLVLQTYAQ